MPESGSAGAGRPIIPRREPGRPAPLSFAQARMWFFAQLEPESTAYHSLRVTRWLGPLDADALERSLAEVIRRHEMLRTRFPVVAGAAEQEVVPAGDFRLPLVDLTALPAERREAQAREWVDREFHRPFDMARGPLLRATLLRLGADEHLLVLLAHHIVTDGWSRRILYRELTSLYAAFAAGKPSPLSELPIQYSDYAAWQRDRLQGERLRRELAYWRGRLDGAPEVLDLPLDRPRPATQTYRGGQVSCPLPADLIGALRALSRRERVTLFMTMLAAFKALLWRYTGQTDLVVGAPVAGRSHKELEELIGCFANTLILRTDCSGDPPFRELLGRVRDTAVSAYAHQELPFERLVEELRPDRSLRYHPLFQVMFNFREFPVTAPEVARLSLEDLDLQRDAALVDLSITLGIEAGEFRCRVSYNRDLFDAATVQRLAGHYQALLAGVAADPEQRLSALPLLGETERRQLLVDWNATRVTHPAALPIHRLVEEQVRRTPEATAVVFEGERLTYRELNAAANRVARALAERGIGRGAFVPILMDRGPELVVSMLAVMKAGAGFIPLDPAWPADRIRQAVADSNGSPVLMRPGESFAEELIGRLPVEVRPGAGDEPNPGTETGPEDPIYAIYTSGSTGTPKAAIVPHRGITNRFLWMNDFFGRASAAAVLMTTPHVYDSAVWQLFWPLINGGTTVIPGPDLELTGDYVSDSIARHGVTMTDFVPSAFNALVPQLVTDPSIRGKLESLRSVIVGGEAITPATTHTFMTHFPGVRVANLYGPTEASIGCIAYEVTGREGGRIPIGRPIANVQVLVLDRSGRPVPIGVAGELHLAGACLGLGYLGDERSTSAAFVPNSYPEIASRILYRTGDLVRYLPDGNLEFLGRADRQVKLRGHRIEPGEVEAALAGQPGVREAVVVVREDRPGDRCLVAYVVSGADDAPSAQQLRTHLRQRLPDYMMPSAFVRLDALPLTAGGKLDYRALPPPDPAGPEPERSFVAPRTPLEREVATVWSEVLGIQRVGAHDNFFDLGGHSLLATTAISRLRRALLVELPLRAIFEAPTPAALASRVEAARGQQQRGDSPSDAGGFPPIVRRAPRDSFPLSFAQQRLWFLDQLEPGSALYTVPCRARLKGALDRGALRRALEALVARHESLRTTFPAMNGQPVQRIHPAGPCELPLVDLGALVPAEREAEARRLAGDEARRPFDLSRGPLFRARLLRLAEDDHALLLTLHHIVSDGWSVGVLFRELGTLYEAFARGESSPLPALPIQYADYAVSQREWLQGPVLERELDYWQRQFRTLPAHLELPSDRRGPGVRAHRGGRVRFTLPAELTRRLREAGLGERATPFMTLLAAFKVLLARYTGQADIVVGTPTAGRTRPETEGLIGFFVNSLALRTDLSGDPTFRELLARVREVTLGALAHQELPFEKLVETLGPERDLSHAPLFQVMFVLQNAPRSERRLQGLTLRHMEIDKGTTKFDLTLKLAEEAGRLRGVLSYDADLFDAAGMERMAAHYRVLLESIAGDPDRRLGDLPLLTEPERRLLLEWNATAREYPRDRCLHELFEAQVARTPDAPAVIAGGRELTYRELSRRADRLARRLRQRGVGPESPVGLCAARSPELLVGLLAILKAGGAYLPLDPGHPVERLVYMLGDAGVRVLLAQPALLAGGLRSKLPSTVSEVVPLEPVGDSSDEPQALRPAPGPGARNLAYVMYTSGSTGQPKGVSVSHQALVNFSLSAAREYRLGPGDRVLQFSSLASDISADEIFPAWLSGAAVVLRDPGPPPGGREFLDLLRRGRVSVVSLPTAFWHSWMEELRLSPQPLPETLRLVIVGGEKAQAADLALWRQVAGDIRWLNSYGPTETTVEATVYEPAPTSPGAAVGDPPIGRPIANTRVYVLDRHLRPVPVGVPGELYIGGDGLARGYLGAPRLTAERFVPDPFAAEPGSRLYRTGDRVRYLDDGNLVFLGRVDHQVKIRGFRIDPAEVEAALAGHPAVREAAVVAAQDAAGGSRLVAYVAPARQPPPTPAELRRFLGERLPEPMVPSAYLVLDALPVLPSGKLNRRALPLPDGARPELEEAFVAPRTPVEETIARIWTEVLKVARVGAHDNFFELGGHSLLATQVIARVRAALEVDVPLRSIFEAPSVAGLAARVVSARAGDASSQVPHLVPVAREAYARSAAHGGINGRAAGR